MAELLLKAHIYKYSFFHT